MHTHWQKERQNHQLSSLFDLEQGKSKQLSYKLLSTNFHQLSSLFDQEQGKSKQLSYKLLSTNFHQLSSLFDQEQGKLKQLSYKLLSTNSHQLSSLFDLCLKARLHGRFLLRCFSFWCMRLNGLTYECIGPSVQSYINQYFCDSTTQLHASEWEKSSQKSPV